MPALTDLSPLLSRSTRREPPEVLLGGYAVRGNVSINDSIDLLTAVETLNADFAQVQEGGNTDVKWAFWDGVTSVTDCDCHVALMVTQTLVSIG